MKNMNHFGSIIYHNSFFWFPEKLNAHINFLGELLYSTIWHLSNAFSHAQFLVLSRKLWLFENCSLIFLFILQLGATLRCKYESLHVLLWIFHRISIGFPHIHIMDTMSKFHLFLGSGLLVTTCWNSRPKYHIVTGMLQVPYFPYWMLLTCPEI